MLLTEIAFMESRQIFLQKSVKLFPHGRLSSIRRTRDDRALPPILGHREKPLENMAGTLMRVRVLADSLLSGQHVHIQLLYVSG